MRRQEYSEPRKRRGAWKEGGQEVFLPLSHPPGEAQVDYGEATIHLNGEQRKVALFVMTLPYSGAIFVQAFPRECTETFLEGHRRAFEFLGGVPNRISYDNLSIAVTKVLGGRERQLTKEFLRLQSCHLFQEHFRLVRRPNEKGNVETLLRYARRNFLVPVPRVASLEELNASLLEDGSLLRRLVPFGGFKGGVFVASGDVNGDGNDDVITGAGVGPRVRAFDGNNLTSITSSLAYDPAFSGGVRVAATDANDDGNAEIITGAGPTAPARIRLFDGTTNGALIPGPAGNFITLDGVTNGAFVGGTGVPDGLPLTAAAGENATSENVPTLAEADALRLVDAAIDRLAAAGYAESDLDALRDLASHGRRLARRDVGFGVGRSDPVGRGRGGPRLVPGRHSVFG